MLKQIITFLLTPFAIGLIGTGFILGLFLAPMIGGYLVADAWLGAFSEWLKGDK